MTPQQSPGHTSTLQAVVRYAGGVLNEMQDLWMHQKLLQDPFRRTAHVRDSSRSAAPGYRRSGSANIASMAPAAPELCCGHASTADTGMRHVSTTNDVSQPVP